MSACSSSPAVTTPPDSSSTTTLAPVDGNNLTPVPPTSTTPPEAEPGAPTTTKQAATLDDLAGVPGRIVRRADDGDIVVSAADGTDEEGIASAELLLSSQPTWSNSGDKLAFSALAEGGPILVIADLATNNPVNGRTVEMTTPAFYLSWSPDDTWIAALRNGASEIELVIIDSRDGGVRVIGPGQPFFTDWASKSALIAAIGGRVLADIPVESEPTQRELEAPLGVFQAPAVLPNGDVIVALRGGETNNVVQLSANASTILGTALGPVVMSLNNAGTTLAVFVAGSAVQSEVISFQPDPPPELPVGLVSIIDLATGAVTTRPETDIAAINWSPDGTILAMLEIRDRAATWLFATGDDVMRGATFTPSNELASSYLPFADQYERSSTWWSPDSSAFVTSGIVDGVSGIWVDRVDDDLGPVRIGDGDIAFWSPK